MYARKPRRSHQHRGKARLRILDHFIRGHDRALWHLDNAHLLTDTDGGIGSPKVICVWDEAAETSSELEAVASSAKGETEVRLANKAARLPFLFA
ncbi:hypothetical protein CS0771_57350 [Catellatospora sp. IY07-71]|nr:hypothetical protein CS0771_57350 [Catellatospora sp. IY07-71]